MKKELIRRIFRGAKWGAAAVCGVGVLAEILYGRAVVPVRPVLLEAFGVRTGLLLELLTGSLWGAGLSVVPLFWNWEGLPRWGRTILHFAAVTGGFLLFALPYTVHPTWNTVSVLAGLAAGIYLLAWAVNYIGSRQDAERIRERLGLPEPDAGRGPFQVQTVLPYLLIAAAVELFLPPLLRVADAPDVPVLTGLLYPFLFLPFASFIAGVDIGKRFSIALVYPVVCGLLTIPHVFWLYNSSALFQIWLAGGAAFAGNLLGAAWKKYRNGK
ncbi:MAG: DUF3021 domain-containing protein [Oscillibacter sp.]|nr:DUF3021 domain-containing protein [Oscillibacter sp.]